MPQLVVLIQVPLVAMRPFSHATDAALCESMGASLRSGRFQIESGANGVKPGGATAALAVVAAHSRAAADAHSAASARRKETEDTGIPSDESNDGVAPGPSWPSKSRVLRFQDRAKALGPAPTPPSVDGCSNADLSGRRRGSVSPGGRRGLRDAAPSRRRRTPP